MVTNLNSKSSIVLLLAEVLSTLLCFGPPLHTAHQSSPKQINVFLSLEASLLFEFRYLESLEQLKSEELRVAELQRSIGEQHAKLAAQKTLYEAVRSDRNLFSRNLIASLDEMTELKQ